MSDAFLDMLATPAKRTPLKSYPNHVRGSYTEPLCTAKLEEQRKTEDQRAAARSIAKRLPVNTVNVHDLAKASHRPDFADDIDRIVQELVAAGDVVYDKATDTYRAPHCKRFKFGGVS